MGYGSVWPTSDEQHSHTHIMPARADLMPLVDLFEGKVVQVEPVENIL